VIGGSIGEGYAMFSFNEQMNEIARLVATVDSNPAKWDANTTFQLSNSYKLANYFCPSLRKLHMRAEKIEMLVKKHDFLQGRRLDRRYIGAASSGRPISLHQLVKISTALKQMTGSRDSEVRQAITYGDGARSAVYSFADNSVIPSMHWVNGDNIDAFRQHLGLRRRQLGPATRLGAPPS
jgi:hypothetical protein